tara:strand:- start:862 stop:1188 length:327 start_codon:yes stop_codon:yes gene_type:complete
VIKIVLPITFYYSLKAEFFFFIINLGCALVAIGATLKAISYPLLINVSPPISWALWRVWNSLAHRSRGGRGRAAGCSGGGFTIGTITSPIAVAIMIMMVIMMVIMMEI